MASTGSWLNEERLRVYPRIFLAVYTGLLLYWAATQFWLVDEPISTLQNDFAGFWSIGHLVLQGRASDAYSPEQAYEAQATYVPEHEVRLPWFYPPRFFFVIGPFAWLPYLPAFFLWTIGSIVCLAIALRALAPHPMTIWIFLASPGLVWTLRWGQSGILAAALLGGAVYLMVRRNDLCAGILIGFLTFKPHIGVLIPFALVAGRQWRVFKVAAATTVLIAGVSTLAFGWEVWPTFLEAIRTSMTLQFAGILPHNQMVSASAFFTSLGASSEAAHTCHGILSFAVLVAVCYVWWRFGASLLACTVLIAGSVLISPHILGYDLVLMAPAIAILAWDGYQRGWLWGERVSYLLLWVWPWVSESVENLTHVCIGIVGSLLLFILTFRRCRVMSEPQPSMEAGRL